MVAVVVLAAVALLGLIDVRVARSRATTAADLAALAAADVLPDLAACELAGRVARAQDTRLVSCQAEGLIVELEVAASVPGRWGLGEVIVRSRAGPPGAP